MRVCECARGSSTTFLSWKFNYKHISFSKSRFTWKKKLNPINFPHESKIYSSNFVMCHMMMVLFAQIQRSTAVCMCLHLYCVVSHRTWVSDEVHWILNVHSVRWHIDFKQRFFHMWIELNRMEWNHWHNWWIHWKSCIDNASIKLSGAIEKHQWYSCFLACLLRLGNELFTAFPSFFLPIMNFPMNHKW